MPKSLLALSLAALGAAHASIALADANEDEELSLRAFGTLAAVHSNDHAADFIGSLVQPSGAGYSHNWALSPDSKIGLQLNYRPTDQFSAVVQVVSQYQYDGTYTPALEWANVAYHITPDVSVRAGRLALPVFMISDSRMVGYANPWLRPPTELYGGEPLTSNDGVDATWRLHAKELTTTLQVLGGHATLRFPEGMQVDAKATWGTNATFEYHSAALHFNYINSRLDVHSPAIDMLFMGYMDMAGAWAPIPALQGARQTALNVVNVYCPINIDVSTIDVGLNYDPGPWFVMGEWGDERGESAFTNAKAWYVTSGLRARSFTPYLTFAAVVADRPLDPGVPTSSLPPALVPTAMMLNEGLTALLSTVDASQRSTSVGLRWDFRKNVDLKIQLDHIDLGAGSPGRLTNLQPGFVPGSRLKLIGVGIDFVY